MNFGILPGDVKMTVAKMDIATQTAVARQRRSLCGRMMKTSLCARYHNGAKTARPGGPEDVIIMFFFYNNIVFYIIDD